MTKQLNFTETRKSFNLTDFITKRCIQLSINANIKSTPVHSNWFTRLFEPERENITVNFELPHPDTTKVVTELQENMKAVQNITRLLDDIDAYMDGIQSTLRL
jgi:hypothetical protein